MTMTTTLRSPLEMGAVEVEHDERKDPAQSTPCT
jgi:hypothetical protein